MKKYGFRPLDFRTGGGLASRLMLLAALQGVLLEGPTIAQSEQNWCARIPSAPAIERASRFGFAPLDFQTAFEEMRPGNHAPINNQTAVGVPGWVPMGFNYLMRLVYSEFEVNFSVVTPSGEQRPYVLPNFHQRSPAGWLPGAMSSWDYEGIHYEVTYLIVPNEPQPVDFCSVTLKNNGTVAAEGRLAITLDGAPSLRADGDLISDRMKPLAIMDPVVRTERLARDAGCVDPRAIAASPWHPGQAHTEWHSCRVGWWGQPIEYLLKAKPGEQLQVFLGYMTPYNLCDQVEASVEGAPAQTLELPAALDPTANEAKLRPYVQRFVGQDTDGDGYIKISVRATARTHTQRALLSLLRGYDLGTEVTEDDIKADKKLEQARYRLDVGAGFMDEVHHLATGLDPTVYALRLNYRPELAPGETRRYALKFPAIDRKEPAWCGYVPRPYDIRQSWRSGMRHPENNAPFSADLPVGTVAADYALYGPKPRQLWKTQEAAARALNAQSGLQQVQSFWDAFVGQGAKLLVPDLAVDNLWKHQLAMLEIYRQQWWPHDYWMQMNGPDFYWEYCSRDGSYENVAWDVAGFPKLSRSLLDTLLVPKSKLPTSRYPFGQWDDKSADYDGAWQTRVNQWDAQGQTLWALSSHYLMTRDKAWLSEHYPAIAKGAEWIIRRRQMERERIKDPEHPAYGLMPMAGDEPPIGGGHSLYVNAFATLSLRRVACMARDLGKPEDAAKYEREADDLQQAMRRSIQKCFVRLNDFAGTIPTSVEVGIRLVDGQEQPNAGEFLTDFGGALVWPTEAVAPFDPLMNGFYQYRQHAGYHKGGLMEWPYVYVDLGISLLRRGEAERAVDLFCAYVANATESNDYGETMRLDDAFPEFTPPRRGVRSQGDAPHGEACANYINFLRNLMLHEEGDTLHLAPGTPRRWLAQHQAIGMERAPTFFGPVTYRLNAEHGDGRIHGEIQLDPQRKPARLLIHLRGPGGRGLKAVKLNGQVWTSFWGDDVLVPAPPSEIKIQAEYKVQ